MLAHRLYSLSSVYFALHQLLRSCSNCRQIRDLPIFLNVDRERETVQCMSKISFCETLLTVAGESSNILISLENQVADLISEHTASLREKE